jgi:hypothetical protein
VEAKEVEARNRISHHASKGRIMFTGVSIRSKGESYRHWAVDEEASSQDSNPS